MKLHIASHLHQSYYALQLALEMETNAVVFSFKMLVQIKKQVTHLEAAPQSSQSCRFTKSAPHRKFFDAELISNRLRTFRLVAF